MTREKFVVRLLDAQDALLAWAEVSAEPKPQERGASCPLYAATPSQFLIEQDGTATRLSVHWCDLDVARVQHLLEPVTVKQGQVFTLSWLEPVWLVPGMRDVPLPAVTVRQSVTVVPPTGSLMGVGK
jgi:hypothetical protein